MQRVKEVKQAIEARDAQALEVFRSLDCKFDEMKTTIARQSRTIMGILIFLQAIYKVVCNVSKMLEQPDENIVALRQQQPTDPRFLYALDPTRGQDIIWEDALGIVHFFPCNEFHDWHVSRKSLAITTDHPLTLLGLQLHGCTSVQGPQGVLQSAANGIQSRREFQRQDSRQAFTRSVCPPTWHEGRHEHDIRRHQDRRGLSTMQDENAGH